jgi:hypothetical protein
MQTLTIQYQNLNCHQKNNIMEELKSIVYKLALQNNPDMIVRAAMIQANQMPKPEETVRANVYKLDFPEGQSPEGMAHSIVMDLKIIETNWFRMSDPFLVQLPNGKSRWTSETTRG